MPKDFYVPFLRDRLGRQAKWSKEPRLDKIAEEKVDWFNRGQEEL